jgi:hypothetical protein
MQRFTSRDLMVSVLPESAGVQMADCATQCTNEPTRMDCATQCTNEPTRMDCATQCTNEPTKAKWADLATDDDLAILQGELALAQR